MRVKKNRGGRFLLSSAATIALFGVCPAFAQVAAGQAAAGASDDSGNAVVTVKMLIDAGIITPEQGRALAAKAKEEAARVAAAAPAQAVAGVSLSPPPAGTVRLPYVSETARAQIKNELRNDVLAQAKAEHWAAPGESAPDWVKNVRLFGDLRVRSQSQFYAKTNANLFLNVAAFNATGPHDITTRAFAVPSLNSTEDRINKLLTRARIGIEAKVADRFQVGFQIATGDDNGPISTNATMTGGLAKRNAWIQLAYAKGEIVKGVNAWAGRFESPFTYTDLLFDPDLAFDGFAGQLDVAKLAGRSDDFTLAIRGGAFPLDIGDDNFPSLAFNKRDFADRYIFSSQVELGKTFAGGVETRLAGAYHNFTNLRGHVSEPCEVYKLDVASTFCSTDALVPSHPTKGNTIMFLRSFDTSQQESAAPFEPQLLGLKYAFRLLDVNGSVSVPISGRVRAKLTGDFIHNFGVDPQNNCNEGPMGMPITNVSADVCGTGATGHWQGSADAWAGYFSIGYPQLFGTKYRLADKGAWAINAAYKRLGSDAVPDSFTDSDFHLGGTNAKGYVIGGAYAPLKNVILAARWLSSNQITGEPFAIDVLQFDLNLAF
jgi:hypothetical protein